jgi:hypothetical protein
MPIVTMTVRKPKSESFKTQALDAFHAALVAAGVNRNDVFHSPTSPGGRGRTVRSG